MNGFILKKNMASCFNCKELAGKPYRCKLKNKIESVDDWCFEHTPNSSNIKPFIETGFYMFNINTQIPEDGHVIGYLLGNCMNDNVKMVYTTFDKTYHLNAEGDFSKDESGKFKYVTYWRYIN